jgi:hypothetical protein
MQPNVSAWQQLAGESQYESQYEINLTANLQHLMLRSDHKTTKQHASTPTDASSTHPHPLMHMPIHTTDPTLLHPILLHCWHHACAWVDAVHSGPVHREWAPNNKNMMPPTI